MDAGFDELFKQINDLLKTIADSADKPLKEKPPMDIEARIGKLERLVEEFKQNSRRYIAQLGITEEDKAAYFAKAANQRQLSQTNEILKETELLQAEIEKKKKFIEENSKQEVRAVSEDISLSEKLLDKKNPNTRKNLFKRVGGNKNWRPL